MRFLDIRRDDRAAWAYFWNGARELSGLDVFQKQVMHARVHQFAEQGS